MRRKIVRALVRFIFRLITRVELIGYENMPEGNFAIAANHIGLLDAMLVYNALDRWDVIMPVAEKYAKHTLFRFVVRSFDGIFIDRFNPDIPAMREIMRRMEHGGVLVISPEGTRSSTGALLEAKPGTCYLAARMGFPILPIAVTGSEDRTVMSNLKHLRKSHITVTAGPIIILPPLKGRDRNEALKDYTNEIMCRIAALLPEDKRGFYKKYPRVKELLAL
jgi:1-acyl-sn-glycerol-3-phosphate acyltransferase